MVGAAMTLPAKLIDQRPADIIWRDDGGPAAAYDLQKRFAEPCRTRSDERLCSEKSYAAFNATLQPIRAAFDHCINRSWAKSHCIGTAKTALATADATAVVAELDAAAAAQTALAEAKRQAALEAERIAAAEVMGADDGRTYLHAAYTERFNAAHRECYEHPGLIRVMQWHTDANPEDYRVITRVRDACRAIMRKQPFVIRADGRNSILGYPIPPFEQADYWLRSRCAQHGRDAWRCIKQAAEGLRTMSVSWRELDYETSSILASLGIRDPAVSHGPLPWHDRPADQRRLP